MPHVETAVDELGGQVVQQLRIGRRVAGADVVQRLDQADAQQIAPQAIDVAAGEVRVVGRGDPGGDLLAPRGVFGRFMFAVEGEFGRGHGLSAVVDDFARRPVRHDLVQRLGALDRRAADLLVPGGRIGLQFQPGEERGGLEVLVLRPAFERVIVALVAVEPHAEEQMGSVFHRVQRIAEDLVVRGGRVLAVRSAGGQDFAHELVVRLARGQLSADPLAKFGGTLRTQELAVDLQQVGPLVRPVLDEILAADQLIHQLVAFRPGVAGVGQELAHGVGRRRQSGQIQMDSADEFVVGAERRRQNLHPLPFGGDQLVDRPPGLGFLPDKAGSVAHDGQRRGRVGAFVAGQHGCLAASDRGHQARAVGRRDFAVAGLDERLARHVAGRSVGVGRDDAHLLGAARSVHDGIVRQHVDLGHALGGQIQPGAVGDPVAQNLVVAVARTHQRAALVRNGTGRLEQHQAVVGRTEIDAPRRQVVGERADVEQCVVSAQGQFESVAARSRSVASALVAAQPRQDRIDVADEIRRVAGGHTLHFDRDLDRPVADGHHDSPAAVRGGQEAAVARHLAHVARDAVLRQSRHVPTLAVGRIAEHQNLNVVGRLADLNRRRFNRDRGQRWQTGRRRRFCRLRLGGRRHCPSIAGGIRRLDLERHERRFRLAAGRVEQTDLTVAAGRSQRRSVGRTGQGVDAGLGDWHVPQPLARIGFEAAHPPRAVQTAGRVDPRTVRMEADVEHAAGQRFVLADLIRIPAAGRRGFHVHLEQFRRPVRAADQQFVAHRMPPDRQLAAAQHARRVRGDVADETLSRHVRHLHGHVAASREDRFPVGREHRASHPVVVSGHVDHFPARFDLDRTDAVVAAADRDLLAVRRPIAAVDRVERHGQRQLQTPLGHVPHLQLAHPPRQATGDGQQRAVRREANRLDPFGQTDQTGHRFAAVHRGQQHLVKTGDGQQRPVG